MNELATSLGQVWFDVAAHLWQTALFVGFLALVGLMLRDAPARLLSWLYWCGIAKMLLPLPWLGGLSARLLDSVAGASTLVVSDRGWGGVSVWIYPERLGSVPADGSTSLSVLWLGLTGIWSLGIAVSLLRRMRRSRMSFHDSEGTLPPELLAALDDAGVSTDLVRIGSVPAPFVSGRSRPVVVLPERLVSVLSREELAAVLVHEREHLRRRDTLRYELLFWVRALFWFYPPVWWLALRIRQTTEMACDEAVVRAGFSPAAYCRSLARTVEFGLSHGGAVSPVGILGHGVSFLRQRLRRIRSERRFETMLTHRFVLAVAAVAVSLLPIAPTPALLAQDAPSTDLSRLADADLPVMLNFQQAPLEKILSALSRASGVEFEIAGSLPDRPVDIVVSRTRLADALTKLGRTAHLKYRVLTPSLIEVRPVLLSGIGDVTAPRIASRIEPDYPEQARKNGVEGKVILQAVIDDDGSVSEVEVLNSTDDVFNDAAVDAVRQWRWEPATSDGDPVSVYFTIVVQFSLNESSKTEI